MKIGDLVWSCSDETGDEGFKPVTHLFVTHPVELIHLSYRRESGSSGDDPDLTLVGTRIHPFWSVDRAAWVDMGELRVGERLRLLDGSFATVTRVQVEHAPCADPAWQPGMAAIGTLGTAADPQTGTFTTYNFEVAKWHTYFAAPAGSTTTHQAVWVHNLNVGICDQGKSLIRKMREAGYSKDDIREFWDKVKSGEIKIDAKGNLHDGRTGQFVAKPHGTTSPSFNTEKARKIWEKEHGRSWPTDPTTGKPIHVHHPVPRSQWIDARRIQHAVSPNIFEPEPEEVAQR